MMDLPIFSMLFPRFLVHTVMKVGVLVLFLSFLTYMVLYILPGNATEVQIGMETVSPDAVEQVRVHPLLGYVQWLFKAIRLDWGVSFFSGERVLTLILERWVLSGTLALLSWSLALCGAILWVWGLHILPHNSWCARLLYIAELSLMALRPLTLGLLVILLVTLLKVPILIYYGGGVLRYILPLLVLVLVQMPVYIKSFAVSVRVIEHSTMILFAKSLGFSSRWLWWREIVPNSLVYVITLSSVQLSYLLGGSVLIEHLFSLPGLGSLLVQSVFSRDIAVVQGIVVVFAGIVGVVQVVLNAVHKNIYGTKGQ